MNSNASPSTESPRKIIFDAYGIDLPIRGGWGLSIDSACVIDKNDSSINNAMPFDGVEIEYVFVEKRIYLELIVFRPKDDSYWGIRWELASQETLNKNGKQYDHLIFDVVGFTKDVWHELTSRFEDIEKNGDWEQLNALNSYREAKAIRFEQHFYFDISSF